MRHIFRLGLVLCFLFTVASAGAKTPVLAPQDAPDGPHQLPSILSSAYPYYQTIRTYSFDTNGNPSAQGWTTHDQTAQTGVYWHVDDFSGLSGYAPLSGSKSMWCGVRPGVVTDPVIPAAPGYGDNWTQILRFPSVTNPYGGTRSILIGLLMSYDLPDPFDKVQVEYRSPAGSGPWVLLDTFTGSATDYYGWQVTPSGPVELRFVVTTDWGGSDETEYDTHGAVELDDVSFEDWILGGYYLEHFETTPVGATTNGSSWLGETPAGFGNYAGIVSGSTVYQGGTPNTTGIWSFFNGSSATYACGGHPSQLAVPYTSVPGSTRPGDYLADEIRSPLIDFTVDQNNQPTNSDMGALAMEFDAYKEVGDGVFFGYRWRFVVNGVLQPWSGTIAQGTVSPTWFGASTLRTSGAVIPAGATHVQFSLFALDFAYAGGPYCHSQGPLLDNVRIIRMYSPVRVTNTNNSGVGSLRQAIIDANSNPDFNAMVFFVNGNGPFTFAPTSPLPSITMPLWIDGFSQTGSIPNGAQFASTSAQLKVVLNGGSAGSNANGLLFSPGSYGVVRGLAIGGFSGAGIRNECTSLIVNGCYVGLDGTGSVQAPNGIGILNTVGGMDIGGVFLEERMLVSASSGDGIRVLNGGTIILNTHLGYDASGFEMANQGEAIHVMGGNNTQIGEPAVGDPCRGEYTDRVWIEAGNIIVEPGASGVMISQPVIEGGYIDLNYDGTTPNDPGDTDTGANGLLNFPVLSSVGATTITGDMDGLANTPLHIEFFSGDGFQSVAHYLGYQDVITNGSGHAGISFSCAAIPPGSHLTATATKNNETSEFGPWITYNNTAPFSGPIPLYDTSNTLRATVQYDNVLSVGNTFLNATTPGSVPNPGTWNVGGTPHYWDVSAAVAYSGNVHVCMYYDPAQVPAPETVLRLLHFQNGQWVDVTDTVDPVNNRICGVVSSLSPFVIAARTGATAAGDLPVPDKFALHANIPNPFNPTTTINYDVRRGGADVTIAVYDVSGRLVRTLVHEHRAAGHYQEQWNGFDEAGRPVASGVYFYRMSAASFVETRKMILLK